MSFITFSTTGPTGSSPRATAFATFLAALRGFRFSSFDLLPVELDSKYLIKLAAILRVAEDDSDLCVARPVQAFVGFDSPGTPLAVAHNHARVEPRSLKFADSPAQTRVQRRL